MSRFLLISCLLLVVALAVQALPRRRLAGSENGTVLADKPKMVCYHESWDYYRTGHAKFQVQSMVPELCTHVIYAYLTIEDDKIKIIDPWLMIDKKDLQHFVESRGNAKALVAIGGVTNEIWSTMAGSEDSRNTFVESVMEFIKKYHFNGVMLDWIYPSDDDKDNFVKLLDKFDESMVGTTYAIAITASPSRDSIDLGYDVEKVTSIVDFIRVLTYDYHGSWEKKTGNASPLHQGDDEDEEDPVSAAPSLKYWAKVGAPKNKLVLSVPLMARTWKLKDASKHGVEAEASGPGTPGPDSKTAGIYTYSELCRAMKKSSSDWKIVHDDKMGTVYTYHETFWASYEDAKTAEAKGKWVKDNGYGGASIYAWGSEDFHGDCGDKFPIIKAINKGLGRM